MSTALELVIETAIRLRAVPGIDMTRICILLETEEIDSVSMALGQLSMDVAPKDFPLPVSSGNGDLIVSGVAVRKR